MRRHPIIALGGHEETDVRTASQLSSTCARKGRAISGALIASRRMPLTVSLANTWPRQQPISYNTSHYDRNSEQMVEFHSGCEQQSKDERVLSARAGYLSQAPCGQSTVSVGLLQPFVVPIMRKCSLGWLIESPAMACYHTVVLAPATSTMPRREMPRLKHRRGPSDGQGQQELPESCA